ncbi:MAG: hypothetical protein AB7F59_10360 [Bdellovibrionales bacterium]
MTSSKLVVGLFSVSLAASTSFAATKAAKAKSAKAQAAAASASTAATTPATEAPTTVEAGPAVAPSASTSVASVSATAAPVAPKKWGLLIDSWTEAGIAATNKANADDSIQQNANHSVLIRPSYKLNDTTSTAVGIEFNHDIVSRNKERTGAMTDPYVQLASSKLATLGAAKIKGYIRPYLPLSLASQDPVKGRDLAVRAQLNIERPISKALTVSYNFEPRYFFQKNKGYSAVNDRGVATFTHQEQYRLLHWASLEASMGKVGFYQNAGIRSRWYNEANDPIQGRSVTPNQRDDLYLESGLSYALLEQLTVVGGVYTDSRNLTQNNNTLEGIYRDDESMYFLELTVAL